MFSDFLRQHTVKTKTGVAFLMLSGNCELGTVFLVLISRFSHSAKTAHLTSLFSAVKRLEEK
jgi:hypothetical protein